MGLLLTVIIICCIIICICRRRRRQDKCKYEYIASKKNTFFFVSATLKATIYIYINNSEQQKRLESYDKHNTLSLN